MRPLILAICLCIAGAVAGLTTVARADGVVTRVVSESNGQITLAFDNVGNSPAPVAYFYVAIAPTGSYSVSYDTGGLEKVTGEIAFAGGESVDSLRAAAAADTITIRQVFPFRGARVLDLRFDLFQFPQGTNEVYRAADPTLTVTYDPAAATNTRQTVDPLLRRLVANENVFPATPRVTRNDPWFSLAPRWVKIPVTARGLYGVSGADLTALGVNLGSINDPSSMRLYSALGQEQPRSYGEPGTWMDGNVMDEVAILVEDGGDGTFDVNDRVVFYGIGASDWADFYDPDAPATEYKRSARDDVSYYYLTWDSQLPGSPARVGTVAGAPAGGGNVTSALERYYGERDLIAEFDYRGDGWLWVNIAKNASVKNANLETVSISNLDSSQPQVFRSVALAPYDSPDTTGNNPDPPNLNEHTAVYKVRRNGVDTTIGQFQWTGGQQRFEQGVPVQIDGYFLANGENLIRLDVPVGNDNPNPKDFMYFAWYSLAYHRLLRATSNWCNFTSDDTTGVVDFAVSNFTSTAGTYVFDVTDMRAPVRVTGAEVTGGTVRFSSSFSGRRRHFCVASTDGLRGASGTTAYVPTDLRADPGGANMVIITDPSFVSAAQRLRSRRLAHLAHYAAPRVEVVTTDAIYDNFSGGMRDPMAVRNYIRFLYDHYSDGSNNPSLAYVVLLGDANEDLRHNRSTQPEFVPSNLFFTPRTTYVFVTDEWFGQMDAEDQVPGHGVMDVAVGRLPAASRTEADAIVQKVIDYETASPVGSWRTRSVLCADDELQTQGSACDTQFTTESELITYEHMPAFVDVVKVYLTEFDQISLIKPAARAEFLKQWNDGALLVNYIGHGSNRQMADEQVFIDNDVTLLNNGLRLPVLMAFSCTIGDFANYSAKSLAEKLLLRQGGGVIATVTASRETYANLNNRLNFPTIERIIALGVRGDRPTVGEALLGAKVAALATSFNATSQEDNNWKYNLLADPSLQLRTPEREIRFDTAGADTLVAGLRATLRGAVYDGGAVDASFEGSVRVQVREPVVNRLYQTRCQSGQTMHYRVPGGVIYEGTADVRSGRFQVSFRVPRSASRGPFAFLTSYADAGAVDAAATLDSALTLAAPTEADSAGLVPLDGAPRVTLGFKSGLETVKPGETLQAIVRDADGINILQTTNEGKQAIVFDNLPVPIDANDYFTFDHGGADTSGVLLYPLPDLEFGEHRAIYKVSDAFGQTALDTLHFSVTDPRNFFAEVLFNFPNPFQTETSFLVRLSDRADIRLDIFTVSGRRVRRLEQVRDGGEVWIHWDGRDAHGGHIANGVYLYVATIDFLDIERPPLELRGKLSKIE